MLICRISGNLLDIWYLLCPVRNVWFPGSHSMKEFLAKILLGQFIIGFGMASISGYLARYLVICWTSGIRNQPDIWDPLFGYPARYLVVCQISGIINQADIRYLVFCYIARYLEVCWISGIINSRILPDICPDIW